MCHRNLRALIWLILAISLVLSHHAIAQTRLGLHVTQEELNIWRQRALSGPYKSAGDVASNTPGDWDRIVANKNSFMSNPSSDIWDGYTGTGCVPRGHTSIEPHSQAIRMRDAAFFALVKDDSSVRNQVLQTLKTQITRPGVDFSNTSKWCLGADTRLNDHNPSFFAADWATRILYSYDYIKSSLSSSDRQTLETWLRNAGNYFRQNSEQVLVDRNYGNETNWLNGTLSSTGQGLAALCGGSQGQTHVNGNNICDLGKWYNNRRGAMVSFYGQVGVLLNDATMKSWATRWVQEYIKYHVYPDSTLNELHRSHGTNAEIGWQYAARTYSYVVDIIDALARAGNASLYGFSTSAGGGSTAGGSKTIKLPAQFIVKTTENTFIIYNWNTSATIENRMDGVWYGSNYYAYDVWLARPNLFWKDPAVTIAYLDPGPKNKLGTTSNREPTYSWMGPAKSYPGVLFMFGQMEGKVWPYPNEPDKGMTAPANLRVTSTGQ